MSEPTTEGIPPEIREKLEKENKGAKKLPPIVTTKAEPTSEELPPVITGSALETLVNENPQLAETMPPPADLTAQVERYKTIINQQNGDIKALKAKLAAAQEESKGGSKLEESRKFRIYLALLEGFAARGDFSPDSLLKASGTAAGAQKALTERMQHAANMVEHAHRSIGNLPANFRF